ncbi:hypothetical protein D9619_002580 [Psilocybe cf. subviscida]|uniref:Aminodeoxychorismate lyase n=1 Tax=Psilocybe cf. subviscida TaxID=2480587 RepID=A0A8H5EU05_9AGAR|nr:hypothetical protein D9619_002580 [Psilocybe cf. subviscida]
MAEFQLLATTRYDPFLKSLQWNNANDGVDPSAFFLLPMHFTRLVSAAQRHGWADSVGNRPSNSDGKDGHGHPEEWLKYDVLKVACVDAVWEQQSALQKEERATAAFRVRITVSNDSQIGVTATRLPVPFTFDPTIVAQFRPSPRSLSSSYSEVVVQEVDGLRTKPLSDPRTIVKVYVDSEPTTRSLFTETKTTLRDVYNHAKSRVSSRVDAGVAAGDWDVLLYGTSIGNNASDTESGKETIMETSIFNIAFFRSSRWLTPSSGQTGCLPGIMRRFLLESELIEEDHDRELTKNSVHADECVLLFNGVQGCRLGTICA